MFPGAFNSARNNPSERLSSSESEEGDVTLDENNGISLDMPSLGTIESIETPNVSIESSRKRQNSEVSEDSVPLKRIIDGISRDSEADENENETESPAFSPHFQQSHQTENEKIHQLEEELKKTNEQLKQAEKRIEDQAQRIQDQATQILSLKEQIVDLENGPECVACGNGPNELFFCSPKCQKSYDQDSGMMSDTD